MGATDYVEGNLENRLLRTRYGPIYRFCHNYVIIFEIYVFGFAWAHACVELICKLGLTRVFKFG